MWSMLKVESVACETCTEMSSKGGTGKLMEDFEYTCESVFGDIEVEDAVMRLFFFTKANPSCNSPTEIPYYEAENDPVCYYCGAENFMRDDGTHYPGCELACLSEKKVLVSKRFKKTVSDPCLTFLFVLY